MTGADPLAEYRDAALYDCENADFEPDGPFYLDYARRAAGPVLEIGCGTGRITIPLARAGLDVTGLDLVPEMLARARHKSDGLPIAWVQADARHFHLGRRFRLIFESGETFQHLLERADQEAMLACVREHLEPDGTFIVGALLTRPEHMATVAEEEPWFTYLDDEGREVRVSGTQTYDPLRQVKVETACRRWHDARGREVVRRVPLALRCLFPQEMEALLHYNGLAVVDRFGDPEFGPLTAESRWMVFVCRPADAAGGPRPESDGQEGRA